MEKHTFKRSGTLSIPLSKKDLTKTLLWLRQKIESGEITDCPVSLESLPDSEDLPSGKNLTYYRLEDILPSEEDSSFMLLKYARWFSKESQRTSSKKSLTTSSLKKILTLIRERYDIVLGSNLVESLSSSEESLDPSLDPSNFVDAMEDLGVFEVQVVDDEPSRF